MARITLLSLALALLLATAAPALAAPPSGDEIKQFRQALEAHWNGNLPRLLQYLRDLDPAPSAINPNPPADGSPPRWSPSPRYGTDSLGNPVLIESAADIRNRYRRLVESELSRIAAAP